MSPYIVYWQSVPRQSVPIYFVLAICPHAFFIGKVSPCILYWQSILISWIFVALVERMLTLRPVDVAGLSLKGLVFTLGKSLVGPVVAPVVTLVPVLVLVGVTLVEGLTMQVANSLSSVHTAMYDT
jgi:hypothetical protein